MLDFSAEPGTRSFTSMSTTWTDDEDADMIESSLQAGSENKMKQGGCSRSYIEISLKYFKVVSDAHARAAFPNKL